MKTINTINTMTLTSLPVSSNYTSVDRSTDEDARMRRDADRARLRRVQGEARRHADAEGRLADAMARASARTAQQARSSRVTSESAELISTATADDVDASGVIAAQMAKSLAMAEDKDEVLAERVAGDTRETLAALPDPAASLMQRLSLGQSRGLLQDCAPMLESLAAQWANRTLQPPVVGSGDSESLESAVDFLHSYADASAGRLAGAERLAKLAMQVRQQLQASMVDAASSTAVLAAANQQIVAQSPGKGHTVRAGWERENVNAVRKVRRDSDDQVSDDEGKLEAAGTAAHAGSDQGKVATVSESSLDKDQRKRRDDTLPLVTLRSI